MKIVLLYSGGLDSTVLLYQLLADGHDVSCVSFNYGQRHAKELKCAEDICALQGLNHKIVELVGLWDIFAGSALTQGDVAVPDGHYTDQSMKLTVVPNRNMVMLSIATAWAIRLQATAIAYAAHRGDHAIYPDCRLEFVEAMKQAIDLCDYARLQLITPFINSTKEDIVRQGLLLNVPFENTWSCYKGSAHHCGTCGTCVERKEAFALAKQQDPTPYQ